MTQFGGSGIIVKVKVCDRQSDRIKTIFLGQSMRAHKNCVVYGG